MGLAPLSISDLGNRVVFGIDPGATGAIAWIDARGMNVFKMLEERASCQALYKLIDTFHPYNPVVYIEKVFINARQGNMVSYVSRYGTLIGSIFALASDTTQIYEVPPKDWQHHYPELETKLDIANKRGRPRAELAADKKARRVEIKTAARDTASALYPHLAPLLKPKGADGMADAILVCLFGAHRLLGNI